VRDLSNRARGNWGERRAARFYTGHGFRVVGLAWRSPDSGVRGDLDVVAVRGRLVVFCEVKARRDAASFGGAVSAVTSRKQDQVRLLAESWLRHHGDDRTEVRFDVIAIDGVRLEHYEAAF
jgi:putative endonuclease